MGTKKKLAQRIRKLEVKAQDWDGNDFLRFADDVQKHLSAAAIAAQDLNRMADHFTKLNDQVMSFARELATTGEPPRRWHKETVKNLRAKLPGASKKILSTAKQLARDVKDARAASYSFRKLFEGSTLGM
jgi:methyl-accepting chemotaxis protein